MKILIFSVFMLVTVPVVGGQYAFPAEKDGKKMELRKLLPQEVGSYKSDGKDQFYDRNTTFRYLDGAAEPYRSYGFKLLMVRRYMKVGHPPIIVELFDMGSPEDAFGVFSFETEGEDVRVGQGSDYGEGLPRFWKGKFFSLNHHYFVSHQNIPQLGKQTNAVLATYLAPFKEKAEELIQATAKNLGMRQP